MRFQQAGIIKARSASCSGTLTGKNLTDVLRITNLRNPYLWNPFWQAMLRRTLSVRVLGTWEYEAPPPGAFLFARGSIFLVRPPLGGYDSLLVHPALRNLVRRPVLYA